MKSSLLWYCRFADGLTRLSLALSCLAVAVLTGAMLYEVAARYLFNAPTIWAFDMAYMSNAAIFLLGNAWVLKQRQHIAITLLYARLPRAMQMALDGLAGLGVIFPLFVLLTVKSGQQTLRAWQTGEVEMVSPWGPVMWPFYAIFTLGLLSFALQVPAGFFKRYCSAMHGAPEGAL